MKISGKRVNFIGIQQAHAVACPGYHVQAVRTGYEEFIAQRTGDLFAYAAKADGKVVAIEDEAVVIEYADGTRANLEIGRRYGTGPGIVVPHDLKPNNLSVGMSFKKGHVLTYNTGYFEPDRMNPWNVIWKNAVSVPVVLMETNDTLEDSSAISQEVANLLSTEITKRKDIVVNFEQEIRKMVKPGDELKSDDILCYIEDAFTSDGTLFDEDTIEALARFAQHAPRAKAHGKVERIEVFYHGDLEDMSVSLRALATASDKQLGRRQKSLGRKTTSGSVDDGFRVEGAPLMLDTAVIRVYITGSHPAGVGDKGVFGNQLKTVFGKVFPKPLRTESGKEVHGRFGRQAIAARIVQSPDIIGTTTILMKLAQQEFIKRYRQG